MKFLITADLPEYGRFSDSMRGGRGFNKQQRGFATKSVPYFPYVYRNVVLDTTNKDLGSVEYHCTGFIYASLLK